MRSIGRRFGLWPADGSVTVDPVEQAVQRIRDLPHPRGNSRCLVTTAGDLFHEAIPAIWIHRCIEAMADRADVEWYIFTKRPERYYAVLDLFKRFRRWPPNVHACCSVCDQETADRMIPHLLVMPSPVLVVEPMIGAVDVLYAAYTGAESVSAMGGISWVLAGPETGPGARPCDPAWAHDLARQCREAQVPLYWKGSDPTMPKETPHV